MSAYSAGPWRVDYDDKHAQAVVSNDHIEIATCWHHSVGAIEKEMRHNARLIAAAPELFEAISKRVGNAEQRAFEDWLARTAPSGDVTQVQDQWENSSEFSDFCDEWEAEHAALAKATGEQQ